MSFPSPENYKEKPALGFSTWVFNKAEQSRGGKKAIHSENKSLFNVCSSYFYITSFEEKNVTIPKKKKLLPDNR